MALIYIGYTAAHTFDTSYFTVIHKKKSLNSRGGVVDGVSMLLWTGVAASVGAHEKREDLSFVHQTPRSFKLIKGHHYMIYPTVYSILPNSTVFIPCFPWLTYFFQYLKQAWRIKIVRQDISSLDDDFI